MINLGRRQAGWRPADEGEGRRMPSWQGGVHRIHQKVRPALQLAPLGIHEAPRSGHAKWSTSRYRCEGRCGLGLTAGVSQSGRRQAEGERRTMRHCMGCIPQQVRLALQQAHIGGVWG